MPQAQLPLAHRPCCDMPCHDLHTFFESGDMAAWNYSTVCPRHDLASGMLRVCGTHSPVMTWTQSLRVVSGSMDCIQRIVWHAEVLDAELEQHLWQQGKLHLYHS